MQHSRLIKALVPSAGLMALLALSTANAVPCGAFASVGGVMIGSADLGTSATTCRNAVAGDANDSVADLNNGAFFGSANWTLLTKTADSQPGDANYWSFSPTNPNGTTSGTFSLQAGLWDLYSKLVIVLKDGGSTTNKTIKWSAYLLPNGAYGPYNWSYDNRKRLSHATLYGVVGRTSVPEPAALALLALGLASATVVLRLRRAGAQAVR